MAPHTLVSHLALGSRIVSSHDVMGVEVRQSEVQSIRLEQHRVFNFGSYPDNCELFRLFYPLGGGALLRPPACISGPRRINAAPPSAAGLVNSRAVGLVNSREVWWRRPKARTPHASFVDMRIGGGGGFGLFAPSKAKHPFLPRRIEWKRH